MYKKEYCIYCNSEQEYVEKQVKQISVLKDKEYSFVVSRPICKKCGKDLGLPLYMDKNRNEVMWQYREYEGLIHIQEIKNLMNLYNLGKSTLSQVLGFGEITIARYLEGQVPAKDYSDKMKFALSSPKYMLYAIEDCKGALSNVAYEKAITAAKSLVNEFRMSQKMLGAIAVLYDCLGEISPMALQKLLYYSDGIYSAKYKKPMFDDVCEAWAYGPVYHDTYRMIKNMASDITSDAKYSIIKNNIDALEEDEKSILRLVASTFGKYSATTLSFISHEEAPWINAREGYADGEWSNEDISKTIMKKYFAKVDKDFGINQVGLDEYIKEKLQKS